MTPYDALKNRLCVPAEFGTGLPYLRYSRATDARDAGEDITLEFQEGEGDSAPTIVLSHSEWVDHPKFRTTPRFQAHLTAEGAFAGTDAEIDRWTQQLDALLSQAGDFRRVG